MPVARRPALSSLLAAQQSDPELGSQLFSAAARIFEQDVPNVDRAIALYQRVLEIDPANLAAAESLQALFQGVERYITPAWYAAKREHGKVVPTWNYVTVQARGTMRAIEDRDWLAAQIEALTHANESGRSEPWAVTDAPEAFVAAQIKGIVGLEIPISRIEGKWKVSQNRNEADRAGVVEGLRAESDEQAAAMADEVASRGR